jgi:hypothetical protein
MANKKKIKYTLSVLVQFRIVITAFGLFFINSSQADPLKFNGFLTNTITKTNHSTPYIETKEYTDNVNYQSGTVLGIQMSKRLDPKVSFHAQFVARGAQPTDETPFSPSFDMLFIDYKLQPNLDIKAGKLIPNTYLISKHLEVGSSYLWARPPVEVYETSYSLLSRVNGLEALYQKNLGSYNLRVQPYIGRLNETLTSRTTGALATLNSDSLVGGGLDLENNWLRLHSSMMLADVTMTDGDGSLMVMHNVSLYSLGIQAEVNRWIVITEAVSVNIGIANFDFSLSAQTQISTLGQINIKIPDQTGYYTTLAYQFERFTPYITVAATSASYSQDQNPVVSAIINQFQQEQRSVSMGTRLDVTPSLALKVEYHQADPINETRGLFTQLPTNNHDLKLWTLAFNVQF